MIEELCEVDEIFKNYCSPKNSLPNHETLTNLKIATSQYSNI